MKNFTKGLLFGSVIGGISSLLLAPRSGQETRQLLTKDFDELNNKKQAFDTSLSNVQESLINLQEAIDLHIPSFVEGITRDIKKFQFHAEPRMAQIQKQVEKIEHELPELPELDS